MPPDKLVSSARIPIGKPSYSPNARRMATEWLITCCIRAWRCSTRPPSMFRPASLDGALSPLRSPAQRSHAIWEDLPEVHLDIGQAERNFAARPTVASAPAGPPSSFLFCFGKPTTLAARRKQEHCAGGEAADAGHAGERRRWCKGRQQKPAPQAHGMAASLVSRLEGPLPYTMVIVPVMPKPAWKSAVHPSS